MTNPASSVGLVAGAKPKQDRADPRPRDWRSALRHSQWDSFLCGRWTVPGVNVDRRVKKTNWGNIGWSVARTRSWLYGAPVRRALFIGTRLLLLCTEHIPSSLVGCGGFPCRQLCSNRGSCICTWSIWRRQSTYSVLGIECDTCCYSVVRNPTAIYDISEVRPECPMASAYIV